MQVSRIETHNNMNFGGIGSRVNPFTRISSSEIKKYIDMCQTKGGYTKDYAKKNIDKCNESELRKLVGKIEKKFKAKKSRWNPFW